MVNEFVERVREVHGSSEGIAPIGYDRDADVDRLDAHLRERLQQKKIPIAVEVSQLEKAVCFLKEQAATMFRESKRDWDIFLEIFKCVLTIHHVTLHCGFYSTMRKAQTEELLGITVIACTTATANRLNGGSNPRSKTFGKLDKTLCVADEIQALSRLECAGVFVQVQ